MPNKISMVFNVLPNTVKASLLTKHSAIHLCCLIWFIGKRFPSKNQPGHFNKKPIPQMVYERINVISRKFILL